MDGREPDRKLPEGISGLVIDELTDEELEDLGSYQRVMDWTPYISADPAILGGKPAVRGTRLAVEFILGLYGQGWTDEMVLASYPRLTRETLRAVFAYAADCVAERRGALGANAATRTR